MKRTGCHPQGVKRPTCLADIVHQRRGWEMHAEAARKLLKTYHGDMWSPAMTLEKSLAFDELFLANPNDSMKDLIEKLAQLNGSNS